MIILLIMTINMHGDYVCRRDLIGGWGGMCVRRDLRGGGMCVRRVPEGDGKEGGMARALQASTLRS